MSAQDAVERPGAALRGTPEERARRGLEAREALPPGQHGDLALPSGRSDPVAVLEQQATTRVPELVPVRHGRMTATPFTFFRGAARAMALDLGAAPSSGLGVQLCGDAHLSNFGLFASPERRSLFDLNDFDESYPGPFEWDVKRLAASIAVAGRANGFSDGERRRTTRAAVRRYRDAVAEFATMRTLEVWYARSEASDIRALLETRVSKKRLKNVDKALAKSRASDSLKAFGKLTEVVDGQVRIKADPPLLVPIEDLMPGEDRDQLLGAIATLLVGYRDSLVSDRRFLLDRFELVGMARKVVGVGSVGTRCWIVLLRGRDDGDPLFLQVKEAEVSVLADQVPSALQPATPPTNQGERVVTGQRLMQAASDIFLGWQHVTGLDGRERDFYVRQLRDMKGSAAVERFDPEAMGIYVELCAWTLARAHARSGDAIAISAYLGEDDAFPDAVADWAEAYADLTEADHAAVVAAVSSGRLAAETGL